MMGLIDAGNNPQAKHDCCCCSCYRAGLQIITVVLHQKRRISSEIRLFYIELSLVRQYVLLLKSNTKNGYPPYRGTRFSLFYPRIKASTLQLEQCFYEVKLSVYDRGIGVCHFHVTVCGVACARSVKETIS